MNHRYHMITALLTLASSAAAVHSQSATAVPVDRPNAADITAIDDLDDLQSPRHTVDPVFAKLKPYRTYYAITGIQPYAQQFLVQFMLGSEPVLATFHGDTVADIQDLKTIQEVSGTLAGGTLKPKVTPPEWLDLELAIRSKIKLLHPTSSKLIVSYQGEMRRIDVTETIMLSSSTQELSRRVAHVTTLHFSQKKGTSGLVVDRGIAQSSSTTALCAQLDPKSCVVRPHFLPFLSWPDAEGRSSFAYSMVRGTSARPENRLKFPELDRELDRIWPIILSTVKELDEGTYVNPIETLLKKQRAGIPAKLQTFFSQGVICGGTPVDGPRKSEKFHSATFGFTLQQLLSGFKKDVTMTEFGLNVTLQANTKSMRIDVRKNSGEHLEFAWDIPNIEDSLLAGNDSLAPRNGEIKRKVIGINSDHNSWKSFPEVRTKQGMNFRCHLMSQTLQTRPQGVQLGGFTF